MRLACRLSTILISLGLLAALAPALAAVEPTPMEQMQPTTMGVAGPAPNPNTNPSPGPSPGPSPSPSPKPKPSPAAAVRVEVPPLVSGERREPWASVPVGDGFPLAKASLTFSKSNQIGMRGALIRTQAISGTNPMAVPAADAASLALLRKDGVDPKLAWCLIDLDGTIKGQRYQWQRLVDLSGVGQVAWFAARSFFSGGTVRREETWLDGAPDMVLDYDESGHVLTEFHFTSRAASSQDYSQRTDFRYRNKLLIGSSLSDAKGKVLEQVSYSHTLDGHVRQTEKVYANGTMERFVYRYNQEGLSGSWADDTDLGQTWFFDAAGRLLRQEEWKNGAVAAQTNVTWADAQGSKMASREVVDPVTEERTVEAFDEQGRVVQIDEFDKKEVVSQTSQEWDQEGHVVLRNTVGPKGAESWIGEYDGQTLVTERYSRNGVPVRVVTRKDDEMTEEMYLDGVLRLRAWYHGTEKYKEEDIRNGQVYRTRTITVP